MLNERKINSDGHDENHNGVIKRGGQHGNEFQSTETEVERHDDHHSDQVEHHDDNEIEKRSKNTMKTNLNSSLNNTITGIAVLFAIIIGFATNADAKSIGEKINSIENDKITECADGIRIIENADISQSIAIEISIDRKDIAINEIIVNSITIEKISRINENSIDQSDISGDISIRRIDKIIDIGRIQIESEKTADTGIIS